MYRYGTAGEITGAKQIQGFVNTVKNTVLRTNIKRAGIISLHR